MNWQGKKVLVTGSEGFIGSHLTERLVELGAKVKAFVLYNSFNSWGWLEHLPGHIIDEIEVFTGDIRELDNCRKAVNGQDYVFHLAALIAIPYSYISPAAYVQTNVQGTLNVLQASMDYGVSKIIHTSTSEVYGTAQYVPIDENHPLQGQSPYSASKIGADKIAESFFCSFNLPVATIRPFNTYGPRQSARAVIPTIITQALSGEIVRLGALHPTRDLNYVKDTVEGFIRVGESSESVGQVVNIGSNREISIGELAGKIISLIGREVTIECQDDRTRPEKSEVFRLHADNTKAIQMLNWKPSYSLEEGLQETIQWIRENLHFYKPGIYNV